MGTLENYVAHELRQGEIFRGQIKIESHGCNGGHGPMLLCPRARANSS